MKQSKTTHNYKQASRAALLDTYYLFVGTYSEPDSNGIFVYRFTSSGGKAALVCTMAGIENPSSLAISPNDHFLYAVSETSGREGGSVFAYAFDHRGGDLRYLNQQLSGGNGPCNISIDQSGRWALVANFNTGSLSVLPIEKDGKLGKIKQTVQHYGHSVNPQKQAKAHVHCVVAAPDNQSILVADLGMDKIFTYEFNPGIGRLSAEEPVLTEVIPGTGPRHLVFSPDGNYLYVIQEIGGVITAFAYDSGKLETLQTISTVPQGFRGKIWAAEIRLSPDGRFLYASNRDDLNDIVTYSVNIKTGKLSYIGRVSSMGKTPRNFTITPDGRYLLVGHRNSNEIIIFKRNSRTGKLVLTEERISVSQAVCLRMIPLQRMQSVRNMYSF